MALPTIPIKSHVIKRIKNSFHCPQRLTFPDGTWLEPDIGLWVIFGRILNQPLERHELPRLFGDLVHKWGRACFRPNPVARPLI
jgi:hypothetical protein